MKVDAAIGAGCAPSRPRARGSTRWRPPSRTATGSAGRFAAAVEAIAAAKGRVILTGMGKSGHVGRKIAATLASTGTPAYFVHPAEASHGDLGMVGQEDVIVALSWSGERASSPTSSPIRAASGDR